MLSHTDPEGVTTRCCYKNTSQFAVNKEYLTISLDSYNLEDIRSLSVTQEPTERPHEVVLGSGGEHGQVQVDHLKGGQ